jgi:hypothetical protein
MNNELENMYNSGNAMLDLGVEPLKRIVYELKRLASDSRPASHDPRAARQAGIEPYCRYVRGKYKDLAEQHRQTRQAEAIKNETEMIVNGTVSQRKVRKPQTALRPPMNFSRQ